MNKVCAIIVTFFPDRDFNLRFKLLLPQIGALVIVDNTPTEYCSESLKLFVSNNVKIQAILNHKNHGIAKALNQGLDYALTHGFKWIVTLDQDTEPYPDMVDTLLASYQACEPKPLVIGGNYLDPRNNFHAVHTGKSGEFYEQKTVITSGSLIQAELAKKIGGFREDYFIDQVDHEFCLRARSQGHRVVISRRPVMDHSVGSDGGVYVSLLGQLPNHPPLRKYYIARNTMITVSNYWWREPQWCLRRIIRLIFGLFCMAILEDQRMKKVKAFVAGIWDALTGRMGETERRWLR